MKDNKKGSNKEHTWNYPRMFFLSSDQWNDPYILSEEESHHLSRVLRVQKGEKVCVLDGKGRVGHFFVEKFSKNRVLLSLIEEKVFSEPINKVILAIAWTKAIRRSWIFEKIVELGAWALWLWKAEHSQVTVNKNHQQTWFNQIISGGKQCRNPWFPQIKILPGGIPDIISYSEQINCVHRQMFVENTCGPAIKLKPTMLNQNGVTVCVIGPEGGFSMQEVEKLKDTGFLPLTLGDRVLRWETAAMLCLGLHWWGNSFID